MLQSFVIMLREGFEMFLIVSIIASYIKKIEQNWLMPAIIWGIAVSIAASIGMGFLLYRGVNEPLWEGLLGVVAAVMVTSLTLHMWKHARTQKTEMESRLIRMSSEKSSKTAVFCGVFLFTVFMITREGMETALMLIQVPQGKIFFGVVLGLLATAGYSYLWLRFSRLINIKLFFQVTGVFLLLFVAQILIYAFHELAEAGVIPNSESFHLATEPLSPSGIYGKWFSVATVVVCAAWLVFAWLKDKFKSTAR